MYLETRIMRKPALVAVCDVMLYFGWHEHNIYLYGWLWSLSLKIWFSPDFTAQPRLYDRRSNDIPDLTINIICPGKSYL